MRAGQYHQVMNPRILVGTERGLWQLRGDTLEPVDALATHDVTALACDRTGTWAVVDDRTLWATHHEDAWEVLASVDGPAATCVARATPNDLLVGTERAHLLRLQGHRLLRVESFETVEGRDDWYTPWGDPADVRSISVSADGTLYVNVHVGGIVRSRDRGTSWTPIVDIEADIHQVLVHPTRSAVVLAAAAAGFGISRNGGDSWEFITTGLPAHYARAVATSGDAVLVSVSTGPRGRRAALYRKPLQGVAGFERCAQLPWFDGNIDTACLAAAGPLVVFGTADGRLFRSTDSGEQWELLSKRLPAVRCVTAG